MAYEKFMHNKYFHPASIQNIKKVWEAEQRQIQEQKKQEELRQQYLKEQEVYQNKEQLGKAHPLSFMYDPPPGYDKQQDGQERLTLVADTGQPTEDSEEAKFDWQVPGGKAPREDTAGSVSVTKDQPFGVEVRNTKCVKCGKWGHINTDKICPLFGQLKPDSGNDKVTGDSHAPLEDGLVFNQRALDRAVNHEAPNQQVIVSDEDGSDLDDLLAGLSKKERKRILREVAKMTDSDSSEEEPKKHNKHKSSKVKKRRTVSSDSASSNADRLKRRKDSTKRSSHKHKRSKVRRKRSRTPDRKHSRHRRH